LLLLALMTLALPANPENAGNFPIGGGASRLPPLIISGTLLQGGHPIAGDVFLSEEIGDLWNMQNVTTGSDGRFIFYGRYDARAHNLLARNGATERQIPLQTWHALDFLWPLDNNYTNSTTTHVKIHIQDAADGRPADQTLVLWDLLRGKTLCQNVMVDNKTNEAKPAHPGPQPMCGLTRIGPGEFEDDLPASLYEVRTTDSGWSSCSWVWASQRNCAAYLPTIDALSLQGPTNEFTLKVRTAPPADAAVVGYVLSAGGAGLPHWDLSIGDGIGMNYTYATTAADGSFRLAMPAGKYALTVIECGKIASDYIEAVRGQTLWIDLQVHDNVGMIPANADNDSQNSAASGICGGAEPTPTARVGGSATESGTGSPASGPATYTGQSTPTPRTRTATSSYVADPGTLPGAGNGVPLVTGALLVVRYDSGLQPMNSGPSSGGMTPPVTAHVVETQHSKGLPMIGMALVATTLVALLAYRRRL